MRGEDRTTGALFSYVDVEARIPAKHPLRAMRRLTETTLADLDHIWLRAYINETDIGKIRLDQTATVKTDTYPGKSYKGRVSFISSSAEFTPKSVETHAERVTLVYRIKIDIDNPTHELVPGMPADASLEAYPAGKP